jgi:hypothetical protein
MTNAFHVVSIGWPVLKCLKRHSIEQRPSRVRGSLRSPGAYAAATFSFTRSIWAPTALSFLLDLLVAAVDVVDAVDPRRALGDQRCQNEGRRRAQVARHDGRALQLAHALDDGRRAFLADAAAHAVQLTDVQEAVREDAFRNHTHPVAEAQQRHELGLKIRREAGVRLGRHLDGFSRRELDTNSVPFSRLIFTPTSSSRSLTAIR